jgi:hypothetical protein
MVDVVVRVRDSGGAESLLQAPKQVIIVTRYQAQKNAWFSQNALRSEPVQFPEGAPVSCRTLTLLRGDAKDSGAQHWSVSITVGSRM